MQILKLAQSQQLIYLMSDSSIKPIKLVFLGSPGVGKTSIMNRLQLRAFNINQASTHQLKSAESKQIIYENHRLILRLADLPAQDRLKMGVIQELKDAEAVILIYDITKRKTFQALQTYIQQINKYNYNKKMHDCTIVLIGNKSDLKEERRVETQEGKQMATTLDIKFFETSAKTCFDRKSVDEVVEAIVPKVMSERFSINNIRQSTVSIQSFRTMQISSKQVERNRPYSKQICKCDIM